MLVYVPVTGYVLAECRTLLGEYLEFSRITQELQNFFPRHAPREYEFDILAHSSPAAFTNIPHDAFTS